jgi:hypothetical protein
MEKRYYTSTNWAPWLGFGFVMSSFAMAFVSNAWLSALLVLLSFLPAIAVRLTLKAYFLLENNQVKFCYDRKKERETNFAINIVDITHLKRIGKSVAIYTETDDVIKRVHDARTFVEDIKQRNPRIELV